ncbi:MAG: NAD-dependent deacylase [Bacteroidales bacterium]|nr:NAD-dependent deacylase [Bacteroidales bacterium]
MKKIVILTGAGISAESGISTFRDSDGLWENYRVEEVASIEGWYANPKLMLDFYNERRRQVEKVQPNAAHKALALLEQKYDVTVITQNIDNLHERGGSSKVIHLHGEITKAQSTGDPFWTRDIGYNDLHIGDCDDHGYQLRPFIVWFGEAVPEIERAAKITTSADILIIIGTSLAVYPAAGLMNYAPQNCVKYLIDPKAVPAGGIAHLNIIREKAGKGVPELVDKLMNE